MDAQPPRRRRARAPGSDGRAVPAVFADLYLDEEDLEPVQRKLFALAAYNAGPSRIAKLRRQAQQKGFNPDLWFDDVEVIAARKIGRETVRYVSNIAKYHVAYTIVSERLPTERTD